MFKLFHCQLAFFAEEFALSNRRWNKHRHVWASSNAAGAHPKFDGTYMTPRHVCVMLKELSLVKPVMGREMVIPMGSLEALK